MEFIFGRFAKIIREKQMKEEREKLSFEEAKMMLLTSRGALVDMLDLAFEFGVITQKERAIMYKRLIDWNSLDKVGKEFSVTRERIRQIEAKVEEKMRFLTEKKYEKNKQENTKINITEKVVFEFVYYENAINVSMALAMAGYYINIKKTDSRYILTVYTDRIK